jgi:hypothetical protein
VYAGIGCFVTCIDSAGYPIITVNRCGVQADSGAVTGFYAITVFNVGARGSCRFKGTGGTAAVTAFGIAVIAFLTGFNNPVATDYFRVAGVGHLIAYIAGLAGIVGGSACVSIFIAVLGAGAESAVVRALNRRSGLAAGQRIA